MLRLFTGGFIATLLLWSSVAEAAIEVGAAQRIITPDPLLPKFLFSPFYETLHNALFSPILKAN